MRETPTAPPFQRVFRQYHEAAERGEVESRLTPGHLYAFGNGVPKNNVLACAWFTRTMLVSGPEDPDLNMYRELTAAEMSASKIDEAGRLARRWQPKPER